jgi:hypothetical protein
MSSRAWFTTWFVLLILGNGAVFSQSAEEALRAAKTTTAVRTTDKISVDGRLDETAWSLAVPVTDFVQYQPQNGGPPTERTEVRILYDDDNLYVGALCFYSDPSQIVATELKRDFAYGESDVFGMVLDTLNDRRSGFSFVANASGAKRDTQVSNESTNQDWDGVWDVKVTRNDQGYVAEFVIPFKTLRFSNSPSQEWGLNMFRRTLSRNEEVTWSPVPVRYRTNRPSIAGALTGLENIHQGRNLKVKPFVTAGGSEVRRAGGQRESLRSLKKAGDYDGGIDLKYSLTPSLTLDATYRTDFAQVEVDQQQVNLTRFNLFFPEKREFFVENSTTFGFGSPTGLPGSSNVMPFFSRRIGLSSAGTPIPIVGGTRVSGKVNNYDLGFLAMKTEHLGTTPSNNYLAGRVKRDLFRNSFVGGIITNRDSTQPGDYNRVYGADARFLFYDRLEFNSYILRSKSSSIPVNAGKDQAWQFSTAWRDDELVISAEYNAVQQNFNPEMGFIRRKNVSQYSADTSWLPRLKRSRTIRNLVFGTTLDYYEGPAGQLETRTQTANTGIQFQNNASINFSLDQTFDRLSDQFTIHAAGPLVVLPAGDYKYRSYTAKFSTNPRVKVSGSGSITGGDFWDGERTSFSGTLHLRPNPHVNVDADYNRNRVDLPAGSFTADLFGVRFLYAFTPRAFLNAYVQYNADTHQVSSNLRFNIIHHPLSDLYLVYNDRRDTVSGQLMERAFIIKLTNLFNF